MRLQVLLNVKNKLVGPFCMECKQIATEFPVQIRQLFLKHTDYEVNNQTKLKITLNNVIIGDLNLLYDNDQIIVEICDNRSRMEVISILMV